MTAQTAPQGSAALEVDAQLARKVASGDPVAQSALGLLYAKEQDFEEARRWLDQAAAQGFPPAYNGIGVMYDNGHGVEQDYAQAAKWHRRGAELDLSIAQSRLGQMYLGVKASCRTGWRRLGGCVQLHRRETPWLSSRLAPCTRLAAADFRSISWRPTSGPTSLRVELRVNDGRGLPRFS